MVVFVVMFVNMAVVMIVMVIMVPASMFVIVYMGFWPLCQAVFRPFCLVLHGFFPAGNLGDFPKLGRWALIPRASVLREGLLWQRFAHYAQGQMGLCFPWTLFFAARLPQKAGKDQSCPKLPHGFPGVPGPVLLGRKNFSPHLSRATRKAVEAGIWQVKKVSFPRKLCCEPAAFWTGAPQRLY